MLPGKLEPRIEVREVQVGEILEVDSLRMFGSDFGQYVFRAREPGLPNDLIPDRIPIENIAADGRVGFKDSFKPGELFLRHVESTCPDRKAAAVTAHVKGARDIHIHRPDFQTQREFRFAFSDMHHDRNVVFACGAAVALHIQPDLLVHA